MALLKKQFLALTGKIHAMSGITKPQRAVSYATWALLVVAMVATVLSALGICTAACSETEKYRFFGRHFSTIGIAFFICFLAASFGRNSRSWEIRLPFDLMLFSALGAENLLVSVQRNFIGHFCPLCLTIAIAVALIVPLRLSELLKIYLWPAVRPTRIALVITLCSRGFVMAVAVLTVLSSASVITAIGIEAPKQQTYSGVSIDAQDIWMGKAGSDVDVVFYSDWFCPFCKKIEPEIEKLLPTLGQRARYSFLDDPIHDHSFNMMPVSLSLELKYKDQYLEGRRALYELAETTKTPTPAQISSTLEKHGIHYDPADTRAVLKAIMASDNFMRANAVHMTPTVVVVNRKNGRSKILVGANEVKDVAILAAVDFVTK